MSCMPARLIMLVVFTVLVSGCVQTRYAWNGYEDMLYTYYKTPSESDRFMQGLYEIIQGSEAEGRVPPGIYAEYGYQLYERGRFADALIWYAKERDTWPESQILMDRMISLAGSRGAGQEQDRQQPQRPAETPVVEKMP